MQNLFEIKDWFGETQNVSLEINQYMNNDNIYIGLSLPDEEDEFYGDVTVNLSNELPPYCGYLDVDGIPSIEDFIKENKLGEDSGLKKQSGFVEYPLYIFNPEKLREICPKQTERYEKDMRAKGKLTDAEMNILTDRKVRS